MRKKEPTVRVEQREGDQVIFKPRAVATVNKELKLLSKIFSLAKIDPNPCREVEKLKGETKRKRWMTESEFQALLPYLTEDRRAHLLDIVLLDVNTGRR